MALITLLLGSYLVDQPDLTVLSHGVYNVQLRFGPVGEILAYGGIGLWDRLTMGVSYGASNLIGAGDPEFYHQPGVQIRVLAVQPGVVMPQVIVGFDNQGYAGYSGDRYGIMSKGLYVQIGQRFEYPELLIEPNLGANYCFEEDGRFDLFAGVKFGIGSTYLIADYSPNIDDDIDDNKGYLNLGLRFVFYEEMFFEVALRDLLDNGSGEDQMNRMIKIGYQQAF